MVCSEVNRRADYLVKAGQAGLEDAAHVRVWAADQRKRFQDPDRPDKLIAEEPQAFGTRSCDQVFGVRSRFNDFDLECGWI